MNFNKRVAFYTLGCKVNQYETESIKNQLIQKGYTEKDFEEEADIYIVNSCTVTSVADRKTRNMLRRAKKVNPHSKVIVTGCYAQTNSKELLEMEDIDYVIGNKYKKGIVNFIEDIENRTLDRLKNDNIFDEYEYTEYEFATLREMSRAYVKIQDGCNNFCSYCKIPFARGRSRSRKRENILKEIEKLVSEGFKEIILIGINLGAYGEDLEEDIDFEDLLEEILQVKGLERVRIGSVYPDKISDRFIELFKYKNLMPHLHISLQSCDDTVLKMMKSEQLAEGVPVFIITADNSEEVMYEAYELGIKDIIEKPFVPYFLRKRIENVIELYEIKEEQRQMITDRIESIEHLCQDVIKLLSKNDSYDKKIEKDIEIIKENTFKILDSLA